MGRRSLRQRIVLLSNILGLLSDMAKKAEGISVKVAADGENPRRAK